MRVLIAVGLATLLSGCGGGLTGDAKAVNDMCAANGGEARYCECVTKALQEKLSAEAFADIAKGGKNSQLDATLDVIGEADAICGKKPVV
jgi:hypothetical protein